ncbi:MAG: hypothetical protein ACO2ZM_00870 [Francisellaceae bacterium]
MANQYSDNFEMNVAKKYGRSAKDVLGDFYRRGISYAEASEMTGYQIWTVKRWCRRYGISLSKKQIDDLSFDREFMNKFQASRLNKYNIFSKPWMTQHFC